MCRARRIAPFRGDFPAVVVALASSIVASHQTSAGRDACRHPIRTYDIISAIFIVAGTDSVRPRYQSLQPS